MALKAEEVKLDLEDELDWKAGYSSSSHPENLFMANNGNLLKHSVSRCNRTKVTVQPLTARQTERCGQTEGL